MDSLRMGAVWIWLVFVFVNIVSGISPKNLGSTSDQIIHIALASD